MTTFVLVHGACHQAAHWDGIVARLQDQGHRAIAVILPGHPESDGSATLDDAIAATCAVITGCGEKVVLVGHSLGGMIVAGAAEHVPDRIARVDFLTALVPADGESAAMIGTGPGFEAADATTIDSLGRATMSADAAKSIFFEGRESEAADLLCATDPGYLTTPVHLSADGFGSVAKRYIVCLRDRAMTPAAQRALAEKWPGMKCVDFDTGHVPLATAPDELVSILIG
jgi:pimeloyl-ACP methyl ester carboxylesterase